MSSINNQKGVSLYLAITIMTILLALGLGLSAIIVSQIKMLKGMENSVIAICAADSGIEKSLYYNRIVCPDESHFLFSEVKDYCRSDFSGLKDTKDWPNPHFFNQPLENKSKFEITVTITETESIIKSTGIYKKTRRAIETTP